MNFKLYLSIVFLFIIAIAARAQKLPNVQKASLRAPQNVKIDGKLNEWDDTFQAHNSATDIYYILCNDDENLYLVVQAVNIESINRILGKGLTFNIQKWGKKNNKERISFTYPSFERNNHITFGFNVGKGSKDTIAEEITIRNANRQIGQYAKNIRVTGIGGIDTVLSVYNETGIKAQSTINARKFYSMEFAFPLKFLQLSSAGDKFAYQLVVNGQVFMSAPDPFAQTAGGEVLRQRQKVVIAQQTAPTDFWGEYTLAKK